uniref:L-2-hydroxyglutarate dehydrogenase, mitochondrial n=1 Tax=Plectus sambesii TaxID=2011161 RepID=A0A914X576_9BILA
MASLSAVLSSFTPLARRRTWSCLSGVLHQQRQVSNAQGTAPMQFDLVVVGGGIVGCATARQMKIAHPNISVAVVEKENILAPHQSGHNSGVVHAGIYYLPGSLKAKLCVQGMQLAYEYFDKHKIPYKKIGKLIVAVEQIEVARLQAIFERATKNECKDIEMISGDRIKDYEPYCKGLQALWSPHTGIVDWGLVTNSFAENFEERGGKVFINYPVQSLGLAGESGDGKQRENTHPVAIGSTVNLPQLRCKWVITCAGLQADRISELSGCSPLPKIVPFRGEYLMLKPEKRYLVKGNIYPVSGFTGLQSLFA